MINCAYHSGNGATAVCSSCGKSLCPACDHRVKGFPLCQDCIVLGADLLRRQNSADYTPFVRRRTSPTVAVLLSLLCPGLGAAYNGQVVKALVYFAVFIGLFQLAVLTHGTPLFVLGIVGMWFFAALDAWRTAQMIRAGLTPNVADDILVKRFSGNPKLWGIVLAVLGAAFLFQSLFDLRRISRSLVPALLIGLGIYILKGYIFKQPDGPNAGWPGHVDTTGHQSYFASGTQTGASAAETATHEAYKRDSRFGGWKGR